MHGHDPKRGDPHQKWQGTSSMRTVQRRGRVCRGAYGGTDGSMTNGGSRLRAGTSDASQGQERDTIAFTLTRSNRKGQIGFLSDIHRIGGGMTCVLRKLLLAGDSSTLCRQPIFLEL